MILGRFLKILVFCGLCIALVACGEKLDPLNNKKDNEKLVGTWEGTYKVNGVDRAVSIDFYNGRNEKKEHVIKAKVIWEQPGSLGSQQTETYGVNVWDDRIYVTNDYEKEGLSIVIQFDYDYFLISDTMTLSKVKVYPYCVEFKGTIWEAKFDTHSYACATHANNILKRNNLPHYEGELPDPNLMPISKVMANKDSPLFKSAYQAYEKAYKALAKGLFSDEINFAAQYSQFAAINSIELKQVIFGPYANLDDKKTAKAEQTVATQRQTEAPPPVQAKPRQNESVKPQQGTTSPSLAAKQKELLGKLLTLSQALALENQNKLTEFDEALKAVGFNEVFVSCGTPSAARYKGNCDRLDSLFGVYKKDIEIAFSDGHLALQVMTVGKHALDSGNAEAMALAIGSLQEQVALSKGLYDSLQRTTIVGEMVKEAELIKAKMN